MNKRERAKSRKAKTQQIKTYFENSVEKHTVGSDKEVLRGPL